MAVLRLLFQEFSAGFGTLTSILSAGEENMKIILSVFCIIIVLMCSREIEAHKAHGPQNEMTNAAMDGNIDEVKKISARNPELVNKMDNAGFLPLNCAVDSGNMAVVEYLLNKGAKVNEKDSDEEAPLKIAVMRGDKEITKLLISKGADVNIKDQKGWTPLHKAASYGYKYLVDLLISKGAQTNSKTKEGESPIDVLVCSGTTLNKDILKTLLSYNSDVQVQSIIELAMNGRWNIVKTILSHQARRFSYVILIILIAPVIRIYYQRAGRRNKDEEDKKVAHYFS